MKLFRLAPLAVLLLLFFIHNEFFEANENAALIFYLLYFSLAMVGVCLTVGFNWRNRLRVNRRHARIRFWSLNIICLLLGGYFVDQSYSLSRDFFANHRESIHYGVYRIESNDVNLHGYYFLQQVHVRELPRGDTRSLSFLFRTKYLQVGNIYKMGYGEHSAFILSASAVTFSPNEGRK